MIFSKIVMRPSVSLAQRTIKPCPISSGGQLFANKTNNFFAQCIAGASPCFRAAEMLHTKLQRRKSEVVSACFDQCVDSPFQQTEECKLIARTGTISDIHQRNRNGRRRRSKVPANFLVTDRL